MAAIFVSQPLSAPQSDRQATAQVYLVRRALVITVSAVALYLAAGVIGSILDSGRSLPPHTGSTVHVVQPGESLWSIARAERPGADLSALVDKLIRLNGGSTIQVGQQLVLAD